jgi:hypothetical protein
LVYEAKLNAHYFSEKRLSGSTCCLLLCFHSTGIVVHQCEEILQNVSTTGKTFAKNAKQNFYICKKHKIKYAIDRSSKYSDTISEQNK